MTKKPGQRIQFHYQTGPFHFPQRERLKEFILLIFTKEGYDVEHVNYIFCTDDFLLSINKQFLKHDTYTDIVTFPLSPKHSPIVSEIYISVDRVRENAKKFAVSFILELYRVMFHGALHLTGYKDKTASQLREMRNRETYYLKRYNVPRNTVSVRNKAH